AFGQEIDVHLRWRGTSKGDLSGLGRQLIPFQEKTKAGSAFLKQLRAAHDQAGALTRPGTEGQKRLGGIHVAHVTDQDQSLDPVLVIVGTLPSAGNLQFQSLETDSFKSGIIIIPAAVSVTQAELQNGPVPIAQVGVGLQGREGGRYVYAEAETGP